MEFHETHFEGYRCAYVLILTNKQNAHLRLKPFQALTSYTTECLASTNTKEYYGKLSIKEHIYNIMFLAFNNLRRTLLNPFIVNCNHYSHAIVMSNPDIFGKF